MKAFGYAASDIEAEVPQRMKEVSLGLSLTEIQTLIEFLQSAKAKFEEGSPTSGQSHVHLRDYWSKWRPTFPDLVVVYE
jgi:hypothetical protein